MRMQKVYLVKASDNLYKIGRTTNLTTRLKNLQRDFPEPLILVHSIETVHGNMIEKHFHLLFRAVRKHGEWFDLSPNQVKEFAEFGPKKAEEMEAQRIHFQAIEKKRQKELKKTQEKRAATIAGSPSTVGEIIKMWRLERGETHWNLYKICGVSAQAIRSIENSSFGRASVGIVRVICVALGHTLAEVDELLPPVHLTNLDFSQQKIRTNKL